MQVTDSAVVALTVAAFLLIAQGTPELSFGTEAATEAVVPVVEIRLEVGRFFVQVALVRAWSAVGSTLELVSTAGIRNQSTAAVAETRQQTVAGPAHGEGDARARDRDRSCQVRRAGCGEGLGERGESRSMVVTV